MRKKVSIAALAVLAALILTGCRNNFIPAMRDIDKFEVSRIIGIDRNASEINLTVASETAKSSGGEQGGGDKAVNIVTTTGESVYEAARKLSLCNKKDPVFGYVDYILIGEDAARENLAKYTDFATRSFDIRYSVKFFVVRGGTAEDAIKKTSGGDKFVADTITNMEMVEDNLSSFSFVNGAQLIEMLGNRDGAVILPAISVVPYGEDKEVLAGGSLPDKSVSADGYAVLSDGKLTGYLDKSYARGYNILTGKAKRSPVNVSGPSGNTVCVELLHTSVKTEPVFLGDKLKSVTYKIRLDVNVAEQHSSENIFSGSIIEALNKKTAEVIKREAEQVIAKSKEYKADCLGLGEKIRLRHPLKWDSLDDWRDKFIELEINVEVTAKVRRVYDLREPNGYKGG